MADKFTWNDTQHMPVEGSFEVNLPGEDFFNGPATSVAVPPGDYKFTLHGAGQVKVNPKGKGKKTATFKHVTDDHGWINSVRDGGNGWTYFTGMTGDFDQPGQDHFEVNGHIFENPEGGGQGFVNIKYDDQRGIVKIAGLLEVTGDTGSEITQDSNQGGRVGLPKTHPGN